MLISVDTFTTNLQVASAIKVGALGISFVSIKPNRRLKTYNTKYLVVKYISTKCFHFISAIARRLSKFPFHNSNYYRDCINQDQEKIYTIYQALVECHAHASYKCHILYLSI